MFGYTNKNPPSLHDTESTTGLGVNIIITWAKTKPTDQ